MSAPATNRNLPASSRTALGARWLGPGISVLVIGLVLLLIYFALGSRKQELSTKYGKRRGNGAADSVNGTGVLAAMFQKAGHRVSTITELSHRIDSIDTVVWTPDDFGPPSQDARQFLDSWLSAGPNRTLVYIGRDYDAAPEYWKRMLVEVEDSRHDEYQRRFAQAASEFDARRVEFPEHDDCQWFVMETTHPTRRVPDLDGPWSADVNAAQAEIELAGRLDIPAVEAVGVATPGDEYSSRPNIEVLLQSENDILAHRYQESWWNQSQVIVVANGSFTLNMPLVNKEHRKLAGRLIAECGKPGSVVFLESGPGELSVRKNKLASSSADALHIFTIWPVSFIFIHFAALGIVYCISVFPIFGRPHQLPGEGRSDFGQHVAALGELLQKTKDKQFAESRIHAYQLQAKRGSGQSHRVSAAKPLHAMVIEPPQQTSETPATSATTNTTSPQITPAQTEKPQS